MALVQHLVILGLLEPLEPLIQEQLVLPEILEVLVEQEIQVLLELLEQALLQER
jgi:hypothetical protein